MNIAINTRLLLHNRLEGIGWFTYETLKIITRSHPEHHFIFLFDRPFHEEFIFSDNITPVVLFPQSRHPFLWYWWFEFSVPAALKKHRADIFLSPDGYLSLCAKTPSLPVIHDLNFEHYPEDLPWVVRRYQTKAGAFCRKANTKPLVPSLPRSATMAPVCSDEGPGTGKSPVELERCCQCKSAAGTESRATISTAVAASSREDVSRANSRDVAPACSAKRIIPLVKFIIIGAG